MAQVRIISVDFYMNPPIGGLDCMYSEFRGCSVHQVPIVRIFGITPTGKKTCLHVHGVFPYIYVPYDGNGPPDGMMYQIASNLDKAINISLGQASSNTQHVYKILLVSGIPFYGYHKKEHQFFKVYFYNPLIMKKACTLLHNGTILGKIFQPHEAHIPYILQFMIDYNLHGMSFINFSQIKYRFDSGRELDVPPDLISPPNLAKQSVCEIEADAFAQHILNKLDIAEGKLTVNPGIKALWEDEKQRRRNKDEESQISPCLTQTRVNMPHTATHVAFKSVLEERLSIALHKESAQNSTDLSVYPAETPSTQSLLNASCVENHILSIQNSDDTLTPETKDLDVTSNSTIILDEDAQSLLGLLKNLRDNVDKDSILSQVAPKDNDSEEEEMDLSLPLGSIQTPKKTEEYPENDSDPDELDDSYFNATVCIPQLDGSSDVSSPQKSNRYNLRSRKISNSTSKESNKCEDEHIQELNRIVNEPYHSKQNSCEHYTYFQHQNLDGTNDGSSSEEDLDWQNIARKSPKKFLSQPVTREYTPLSVTFNSPSKSDNSLNHRGLQDQINEMSSNKLSKNNEKNSDEVKTIQKSAQQNSDNSQKKHKRLLTFADIGITPLNCTAVEEVVVCRYTPTKSNSKEQVLNAHDCEINHKESRLDMNNETLRITAQVCSQTEKKCEEIENNNLHSVLDPNIPRNIAKRNTEENDIHLQNTSQNFTNSTQYSDDLFSPETDNLLIVEFSEKSNHKQSTSNFNTKDKDIPSSISTELTPYQHQNKINVSKLTETLTTYNIEDFEGSHINDDGLILSVPKYNPPSPKTIDSTLADYNIPKVRHEEPFYSDCNDVTGNVEVGNNVLKISSKTPADLSEFESFTKGIEFYNRCILENLASKELSKKEITNYKLTFYKDKDCIITPAFLPPTRSEVETSLKTKSGSHDETVVQKERIKIRVPQSPNARDDDDSCESLSISPCTPTDISKNSIDSEITRRNSPVIKKNKALLKHKKHQKRKKEVNNASKSGESHANSCRISGASFSNTHNFAVSLNNLQEVKVITDHQYISVLSMEVHVQTRADFEPDPQLDPIRVIFYSVHQDAPNSNIVSGAFAVNTLPHSPTKVKTSILQGTGISSDLLKLVDSEMNLINEFVAYIKNSDPDVLVGYEIEMHSWGYLIERGYVLGLNLISLLSKVPGDIMLAKSDEKSTSELRLTGRIIIDFWRLMRHEIALQSYTFENIVYHVLHQRVPLYSFKELSFWWNHPTAVYRHRTVDYFLFRVQATLKIVNQLDLINRTSELARLFGIQFYEVLSRGSQFRVESMMLRLAKPLNYIAVSPSVQQRAKMRAPESLPLIMEPESKFYADPVIVLDFQSLYPSMIIAYNYCFSTCLGRIEHLGQNSPFEFGATQLKVSWNRVSKLLKNDMLNFSPCGVVFANSEIRQGILPRMLQEILDTRLMVKKSMKENAHDKVLQKVLHARQLGLKLIANVTYGYTAANFSGRMPAIELGDSIVSKGRETLQRAIKLVENNSKWGTRVVYGDTDSLFVLIPGKSREDAFRIGSEIAEAVTNDNPSPVKLKLEKVFHPCILQTKKRYVGYQYESPDQKHPEFCAKGIETVRRDGCPAVSKMLEKCLKMLFDTRDVSVIRQYVIRQFSKLLTGRVSIQDLTFAKEYRGASGYRPGACVPALELARKWTVLDKRKEPRRGERVPYVIINGPPGLPLIRLIRSPRDLLSDSSLRPNALYYITKAIIPPINRCFNLIGADLNIWFNTMPRKQIQYLPSSSPVKGKKSTISQYFSSTSCALCGQQTQSGLCDTCEAKTQESAILLHEKLRIWERNHFETNMICQSCCERAEDLMCISLNCPVLYRRAQTEKDLQQSVFVRDLLSKLPESDYF